MNVEASFALRFSSFFFNTVVWFYRVTMFWKNLKKKERKIKSPINWSSYWRKDSKNWVYMFYLSLPSTFLELEYEPLDFFLPNQQRDIHLRWSDTRMRLFWLLIYNIYTTIIYILTLIVASQNKFHYSFLFHLLRFQNVL